MRRTCTDSEVSCQHSTQRLTGDLLSTLLFSANGISLLLPNKKIVPKRGLHGKQYLDKHKSGAKAIFWHKNHQLWTQGRRRRVHKNRAYAVQGISQGTATQWMIFCFFICFISTQASYIFCSSHLCFGAWKCFGGSRVAKRLQHACIPTKKVLGKYCWSRPYCPNRDIDISILEVEPLSRN